MLCPQCQAVCTPDDNYCHRCGHYLRLYRLPVRAPQRPLAPLGRVAPALLRGGAYLALGALGQWALRQGLRLLLSRALAPGGRRALPAQGRGQLPAPSPGPREEAFLYTYRQTVVVRRLLRR
jgi:hypothetical protein